MIEVVSSSIQQTLAVGAAVAAMARAGDVIALDGELGAGKTQFVRGVARGMGLDPSAVSSPTFVLMHEYEAQGDDPGALVLVHIDAYRLQSAGEFDTLGWGDELLEGAVVAIEWASRVAEGLGPDRLEVRMAHADPGRRLRLTGHGTWAHRMPRLATDLQGVL